MKKNRLSVWFYVLVVYVLFQFSWWTYYLIRLNRETLELKQQLARSESSELLELQQEFSNSVIMIVGEGSVFLLLLLLGIIQIKKAINKKVRLARKQQNFLSAVSHELKTPIASTQLLLETLLKREVEPEKQKEILHSTLSENHRLNQLTDNLLLATQIDFSNYIVHEEEINLSEITQKIVEKLSSSIGKQHHITIHCPSEIHLKTDQSAYESIVTNLFENAVKYSEKGTNIIVKLHENSGSVMLALADQGIGISDKEAKHIFDKFYRVGNENTRKTKGTGLGLYITKQLCELIGAKIELIRNRSEKGSTFTVAFHKT